MTVDLLKAQLGLVPSGKFSDVNRIGNVGTILFFSNHDEFSKCYQGGAEDTVTDRYSSLATSRYLARAGEYFLSVASDIYMKDYFDGIEIFGIRPLNVA